MEPLCYIAVHKMWEKAKPKRNCYIQEWEQPRKALFTTTHLTKDIIDGKS